ncbi:Crp/Fnr family transcriptional regulator [Sphingomonas bacterium]|uniref:Crp/Fnr family transcriptional regulator n=1 Tax=Sphingomonas bacterium TaxID=1895847 RepID=UPI0015766C2C|nr:Crp/Fnr family transcriptional regulator [Sphingomonas bacterium]
MELSGQQREDARRFLLGRRRSELTQDERAALAAVLSARMVIPARRTIVRRGEEVRHSTLLVSGFLSRYMDARDGYRQIVSVQVPGDFVDLHGYPLRRLDHGIATLTEATVVTVSHEDLTGLVKRFPHLARMLWFSTLLDAAMHREWIFRLGRLEAAGRLAHFLCETYERLRAVGLAADGRFEFPLTQQDIGEACGLTSVHVNRTLRRLREDGLVEVSAREARLLDMSKLAALGEFEPDYLYLDDERRSVR